MVTNLNNLDTLTDDTYQSAHEDAVLVSHNRRGMLKITGESRLDLLNRMTTQGLLGLSSGEGTATIFTTEIGRIIDRVILYTSSDTVYMLTGDDHADPLARYLMRNVFFNDDFHLTDISADTAVWGVYGPRAAERVARAILPASSTKSGLTEPSFRSGLTDLGPESLSNLPLHHWLEVDLDGAKAYVHRTDPVAGDGFFITSTTADSVIVADRLIEAGIIPIDETAYDYLRIESGLPRFGREITLDYIPLETGLWDDVSFSKGCYTGQEIIARMESRGKLAKRLVALRPDSPVETGAAILARARNVGAYGREVGTITSAADGPAGPLALGYVKTAAIDDALGTADGVALAVRPL